MNEYIYSLLIVHYISGRNASFFQKATKIFSRAFVSKLNISKIKNHKSIKYLTRTFVITNTEEKVNFLSLYRKHAELCSCHVDHGHFFLCCKGGKQTKINLVKS